MAADFASSTFDHASYASKRPTYPAQLYATLLAYHAGPRHLLLDLGTGHGLVARALAPAFGRVVATDPSPGMLAQAKALSSDFPNIDFTAAAAESVPFVADASVDMAVAGQAAHWFDHARWWPEMRRVLRPGGTLAVWGYKDPVLVGRPAASRVLAEYAYGRDEGQLGAYWTLPGRAIVQDKLRPLVPPKDGWHDVRRVEYEPSAAGPGQGEGVVLLEMRLTVREMMGYVRTWSAVHKWQEAHPDARARDAGGRGDVVDGMFDRVRAAEEEWERDPQWRDSEVHLEFGTGLIMARRT